MASWFDELNRRLSGGKLPSAPAPRDRDLSESAMPVHGPGTPSGKPPLQEGPTPFPDIAPSDVSEQKYGARLKRLLQLTKGTGLDDYLGAAFPALLLNRFDPEFLYPEDLLMFAPMNSATGGANFARAVLVNPHGSGVLGVVTRLSGSSGAAAVNFQVGLDNYTPATLPNVTLRPSCRDLRAFLQSSNANAGRLYIHTDGNIAAPFGVGQVLNKVAPANSSVAWDGGADDPVAIIAPGTGLVLVPSAGATSLEGDVFWRETKLPVLLG